MKFLFLLLMACWVPGAVAAADIPPSREAITFSYAPVVKKAAPAVVNIYTKRRIKIEAGLPTFMNDPFFNQFFAESHGGPAREKTVSALGSGVIVRPDGMIVTSYHVVKDAQQVTVALTDKREFEASIEMRDPKSDIAFLRIKTPGPLPFLAMRDSDTLEVGDLVLAIGNPFGVGQTVTSGIVSALARQAAGVSDYQFFIQTDAAINPGNSGGALVDMQGKLIGINTAIYSQNGGGSNGVGFAIPANMVRSLLNGKLQDGKVLKPWLGIAVQPVTGEMAESLGLPAAKGVLVRHILPGSPAQASGMKSGDVIFSVNGVDINSEQEMQYRIALSPIGSAGAFQIMRQGQLRTLSVTMAPPPEQPPRDLRVLSGNHPLNGVTVANLSPAVSAELGIEEMTGGVVVISAGNNGGGFALPLAPGDRLLNIDGQPVETTAQLERLLKQSARSWEITYQHAGETLTLDVRM